MVNVGFSGIELDLRKWIYSICREQK